jgi:PAS domain S-box-containing protein
LSLDMNETVSSGGDWQSTLDALQDAVWLLDAEQRIVRCNKASCTLFGKTADELLGRHCWEIVHGTTLPIPECPACRMYSSQHRESMDLAVGDKWYHVTVDPQLSDGDGKPWTVHVIRDITERKQAESRLRALNSSLGQLVDENAQDLDHAISALERAQKALQTSEREKLAILDAPREHVLLLDQDMTIRWPNLAACESVNMSREALTGCKCYAIWQDRTSPCPDCPVVAAMESGAECEGEKETPDGQAWSIRGYPIKNEQGDVVGGVEMTRNITERKRMEKELRESETRFRTMFEMHDAVMLLIDPSSGRMVDANRAAVRFYGYPQARLRQMHIGDMNTMTPEEIAAEMERARRLEKNYFIFQHRLCNAEIRTVEVHSTPIEFQHRQLLFSIVHDITERKKAESRLVEQQRRLRQLAAQLAHAQDKEQRRIADGLHDDVGQLLAASKINLAVARGTDSPEKAAASRQLAEDLLNEASEKIGGLCFELSSSTLYRLGLYDAMVELAASMEARYGLHVDLTGATGEARLNDATATVVFKGVRELLFNVVKHADVKGAAVTMLVDDKNLRLAVEDHGSGFYHDETTGEVDMGTGFGLFGMRERLLDLGGELQIESTPQTCTRVSIQVPLTDGVMN